MKGFAKNAARPWGFTLVELLTVIAIIAVLATLTSATLVNAQRKGRKAVSTSNLRQIALAFNIYTDDHSKRPATFREMSQSKYISEAVLLCPEDRIHRNWAGLLESQDSGRMPDPIVILPGTDAPASPEQQNTDVAHSYFKSFDYLDRIWQPIERSAMGGIAACQLHGIGRQSKDVPPSFGAYQGLVLRALKDGSVITRQVFLPNTDGVGSAMNPSYGGTNVLETPLLPLFLDPTEF